MATETDILRLALLAYEAASTPEVWDEFLRRVAEHVRADISVLQVHDFKHRSSSAYRVHGVVSPLAQSYNKHYSRVNVWRERGRALYVPGRVNVDEDYCPRTVLERSEFYNDYLLRIGGARGMSVVIAREGGRAPTLTALRGRNRERFSDEEKAVAAALAPHLSKAWMLLQKMELLRAGEAVMDTLPLGVVYVLPGGRALYWNRAADQMAQARDGLEWRAGELAATDRCADGQLQRALLDAVNPRARTSPCVVTVARPSRKRDYLLTVAPWRGQTGQFTGMAPPAAVVLVTDPESQTPAGEDLLRSTYQLTPREAALAAKLSTGVSLERAAEDLAMTYETARTHLRRIFSKTGVSRQTELLLLMARLPAWPESEERRENGHG